MDDYIVFLDGFRACAIRTNILDAFFLIMIVKADADTRGLRDRADQPECGKRHGQTWDVWSAADIIRGINVLTNEEGDVERPHP